MRLSCRRRAFHRKPESERTWCRRAAPLRRHRPDDTGLSASAFPGVRPKGSCIITQWVSSSGAVRVLLPEEEDDPTPGGDGDGHGEKAKRTCRNGADLI